MKITGKFNSLMYAIFADGDEIYRAGNCPKQSQGYVPSEEGVGLATMKSYCEVSARQLAAEQAGENELGEVSFCGDLGELNPPSKFYCVAAANGVAIEFFTKNTSMTDLCVGIIGAYWQHPHFVRGLDEVDPHLQTRSKFHEWLHHKDFGISFNSVANGVIQSDADLLTPDSIAQIRSTLDQSLKLEK